MRRNPEFVLCNVASTHVLMPAGSAAVNLNGMVTLNDTGVAIWNKLERETAFEELLALILDAYDVNEETARDDLQRFLKTLKSINGIID